MTPKDKEKLKGYPINGIALIRLKNNICLSNGVFLMPKKLFLPVVKILIIPYSEKVLHTL